MTFVHCFRHFRRNGYPIRAAACRALHVARHGFDRKQY